MGSGQIRIESAKTWNRPLHAAKALWKDSALLNLSALAREADINPHTLQAKIRRQSPLTGAETAALVAALKRFRLAPVAWVSSASRDVGPCVRSGERMRLAGEIGPHAVSRPCLRPSRLRATWLPGGSHSCRDAFRGLFPPRRMLAWHHPEC